MFEGTIQQKIDLQNSEESVANAGLSSQILSSQKYLRGRYTTARPPRKRSWFRKVCSLCPICLIRHFTTTFRSLFSFGRKGLPSSGKSVRYSGFSIQLHPIRIIHVEALLLDRINIARSMVKHNILILYKSHALGAYSLRRT